VFQIDFSEEIPHIDDYRTSTAMEVRLRNVWRYFVR